MYVLPTASTTSAHSSSSAIQKLLLECGRVHSGILLLLLCAQAVRSACTVTDTHTYKCQVLVPQLDNKCFHDTKSAQEQPGLRMPQVPI